MCLLAGAIRLPYLHRIPLITDEADDVLLASQIVAGARPLMAQASHNGPVLHYLMALGLAVGGGGRWPRWLFWGLGTLTVGLTYCLGASLSAGAREERLEASDRRRLAIRRRDRLVGLVAALLVAVSFVPVVVNSHIAWPNASSPFWTTLALLAVTEAHRRANPRWLVVAGPLGGLALQTHVSVLPVFLAAAVWILWQHPRWLRTKWPWLGLMAAGIAIGNIVLYNVQTGGDSIRSAQARHYAYAFGAPWPEVLANLRSCLRMSYQLVTSSFLGRDPEQGTPELAALLRSPVPLLYGFVALLALVASARQTALPLLTWLSTVAILALFNRGYRYYLHARYLAAGLPLIYCALGLWLAHWLGNGGKSRLWFVSWPGAGFRSADGRHRHPTGSSLAVLALLVFLLGYPLWRLERYYRTQVAERRTNDRFWQVVDCLKPLATDEAPVRLDRELYHIATAGGGNALKLFSGLLAAEGTPYRKPDAEDILDHWPGAYFVLTERTRGQLAERFLLERVDACDPLAPYGRGHFDVWRMVGETSTGG